MLTDDLKNYIQGQSGNIEIGIAPVDGLRPQDVTALQQLNKIMDNTPLSMLQMLKFFSPVIFSIMLQQLL